MATIVSQCVKCSIRQPSQCSSFGQRAGPATTSSIKVGQKLLFERADCRVGFLQLLKLGRRQRTSSQMKLAQNLREYQALIGIGRFGFQPAVAVEQLLVTELGASPGLQKLITSTHCSGPFNTHASHRRQGMECILELLIKQFDRQYECVPGGACSMISNEILQHGDAMLEQLFKSRFELPNIQFGIVEQNAIVHQCKSSGHQRLQELTVRTVTLSASCRVQRSHDYHPQLRTLAKSVRRALTRWAFSTSGWGKTAQSAP